MNKFNYEKMKNLKNKRIAVLAADGYEQSELVEPVNALKENGAQVEIISLKSGGTDHGSSIEPRPGRIL